MLPLPLPLPLLLSLLLSRRGALRALPKHLLTLSEVDFELRLFRLLTLASSFLLVALIFPSHCVGRTNSTNDGGFCAARLGQRKRLLLTTARANYFGIPKRRRGCCGGAQRRYYCR